MASDRVVSLGLPGTAREGVGNMLFNQFEEARKNKADAAQLDVTEGIRSKYRQQEAAQGNVFNEGLTRLRDFLNTQATDTAYARSQEAQKQAAGHLESMITGAANQGVSMPSITETKGQVPEAGYPAT